MMDDEANRTRSGFQAGGLGRPDPPSQQEPPRPSGTMGGTPQFQQAGQQLGASAGSAGQAG